MIFRFGSYLHPSYLHLLLGKVIFWRGNCGSIIMKIKKYNYENMRKNGQKAKHLFHGKSNKIEVLYIYRNIFTGLLTIYRFNSFKILS